MNVTAEITKQLNKSWEFRFQSKAELSKQILDSLLENHELEFWTDDNKVNKILLESSYFRAQKKMCKALENVEKAKKLLQHASKETHFQFYFQWGLNLDVQSKFAESLEKYQRALNFAPGTVEVMIAKVNLAICRYHLGIPLNGLYQQIKALVKVNEGHPYCRGFNNIEMILLKKRFCDGELTVVPHNLEESFSQSHYFSAWVTSLPWLNNQNTAQVDEFVDRCLSSEELFNKSYRLETITLDNRFEVKSPESIQCKIDRLYLWVWKWIGAPESKIKSYLEDELSENEIWQTTQKMTSEDLLFMESLGGWLSIFNHDFARKFKIWSEKNLPAKDEAKSLFFQIDRKARQAVLSQSWDIFYKYSKSIELPFIQKYLDYINSLDLNTLYSSNKDVALKIYLSEGILKSEGLTVKSHTLCQLVYLLKKDKNISFSDVIRDCFGIDGYDVFSHAPKVNNLLQRFKKFTFKALNLSTKEGVIYLEDNLNEILILQSKPQQVHFPKIVIPVTSLKNKLTIKKENKQALNYRAQVLLLLEKQQIVSRQQIQDQLHLSKAATTRWLSEVVSEGLLTRQGKGRNTNYILSK